MLPIRVYYEDTDAGGVVYHARYLHFMERGRTEWLRDLGFEQDRLREQAGVLFVVNRMELDFVAPARFNEQLEVHTDLSQCGRASLNFAQVIQRSGQPLCRALVRVACVDAQRFKPTAIPPSLLRELTHAE
jgi:acyl-CoA thioester hydrolase